MATQDKTELLYKKFLGTPAGNPGISYVGELGSARTNLFAQTQLFSQPIPQIAPESTDFIVSGYVTLVGGKTTIVQTDPGSTTRLGTIKTSKSYPWLQKIEYLQLQQATPFSYYFNNPVSSINLLQNIIPFNYDLGGSYNYALYKSGTDPSTQASLLPSNPPNWFIDSDAGYLYFPTAANDWSNFFSGLFPVISFYRYNGTMGIPTNLGNFAGAYSQGTGAIAYGDYAGFTGQGANSIAIGAYAGPTGLTANSIVLNASGTGLAGTGPTGGFYVAPIASYSGSTGPFMLLAYGADKQIVCVTGAALTAMNISSSSSAGGVITGATGSFTALGATTISTSSITGATGSFTALSAISITGNTGSFMNIVSSKIGTNAGSTNQGTNAIAFGNSAGSFNQGTNSIAIGAFAGPTGLTANSIVLNASGTGLAGTGPTGGFYVAPVASYSGSTGPFMLLAYGADKQIVGVTGAALTAMNIGGGGGSSNPNPQLVTLGQNAGTTGAVNIGFNAGQFSQGTGSIAIGYNAGPTGQGGVTGSSYKTSWVAASATGTIALVYSTMSPNGQYQIMPNNNSDGGFYYTTNGNTANPTWLFKSSTVPANIFRIVLVSDNKNAVLMNTSYGFSSNFENINFSSTDLGIGVIVAAKGSSDLSTILATTYTVSTANGYYLRSGTVSTTPAFVNITPQLTFTSSSNLYVNNNTTIGLSKDGDICITSLSTGTSGSGSLPGSSLYFTSILKLSTASSISYTNSTGYTCANVNSVTIITLTTANSSIKVGMYISYIVGGSTTGSTNAFVTAISTDNTIITLSANIIPSSQTITSITFRTFALLDKVTPLPDYSAVNKSANEWKVVALSRGSTDTKYYMLVGGVNTFVYLGIYNTNTGTYLPTFTKTSLPQTNWQSYTISATGQYMYALTTTGIVYYSDSYGESWTSYRGPSDTSYSNTGLLSLSDNGIYGLMTNNSTINPIYNFNTVYTNTTGNALALGTNAGQTNQGAGSVAIGNGAGQTETALSYGSFAKWFTAVSISTSINTVACSASGQIQLYGRSADVFYPYISKDSGQTFNVIATSDLPTAVQNIYAISADGNTIVIVTSSNATAYISPNTGASFPIRYTCGTGSETARAVAVSGEGQYIVIITNLGVYFSNNFGKTFTKVFSATITTASCSISYTGQYISTIINGNYYISNNYTVILPSIYFPFESISGTNIDGVVVNTNNGPIATNSSFKKIGSSSAAFNGSSNYIVTPVNYNIGTGFTICCWAYFTNLNRQFVWCLSAGYTNAYGAFIYLFLDTGNTINLVYNGSTIRSVTYTIPSLATGTWYHFSSSFNQNGTSTLYVNGVSVGTFTAADSSLVASWAGSTFVNNYPNSPNNQVIVIGTNSYSDDPGFFSGYIDDFRHYGIVLTASQIATIYNITTATATTLAVSPSGQYQAYTNTNNMNLSTNFGESYSGLTTPTNINSIVISQNGQMLAYNDLAAIYYSSNMGASWFTINPTALTAPVSLAMSADGSYFITASLTAVYTLNIDAAGNSVAIGNSAGQINQSVNAIAIGNAAGQINQPANTIVLNASGTALNPTVTNGCFIAPIATQANSTSTFFNLLMYGSDNQIVQSNNLKMDANGRFYINTGLIITGTRPLYTQNIETQETTDLNINVPTSTNLCNFKVNGKTILSVNSIGIRPASDTLSLIYSSMPTLKFTDGTNNMSIMSYVGGAEFRYAGTTRLGFDATGMYVNNIRNISGVNLDINGNGAGTVNLQSYGNNIFQTNATGARVTASSGSLVFTNTANIQTDSDGFNWYIGGASQVGYFDKNAWAPGYGWRIHSNAFATYECAYDMTIQCKTGGVPQYQANNRIINIITPNSINSPNDIGGWGWYCGATVFRSENGGNQGNGIGISTSSSPGYGGNNWGYITAVNPGVAWANWIFAGAVGYWYCNGTACAYINSTSGWQAVSDERCKKDINDLSTKKSLQRVLKCKPKYYKRILKEPKGEHPIPLRQQDIDRVDIGLLAQEVLEYNPHCVSTWEDDTEDGKKVERLGLAYQDFIIHLIGSVQEQQKQIDTQQAQIQAQQAKNEEQSQAINTLTETVNSLTEHLATQQAQIQAQQVKIEEQSQSINTLTESVKSLTEHLATLTAAFNKIVKE